MRIAEAIHAVGSSLNLWVGAPVPRERGEELVRRVQVIRKALCVLMEALPDLPLDGVAEVERLLVMTDDQNAHPELPPDHHERVQEALRSVLVALLARGEVEQARQEQIRIAVATIALPAEGELKKLSRYRKTIEDGLQRRLQALEMMRKLAADRPGQPEPERSKEYRIRLRLVT